MYNTCVEHNKNTTGAIAAQRLCATIYTVTLLMNQQACELCNS
jgi:hypothetical protein